MNALEVLKDAEDLVMKGSVGFDPYTLSLEPNVVVSNGINTLLFEYESEGVYVGHYLCRNKGKQALGDSNEFIGKMFSGPARVIKGLVPVSRPDVKWMTRKLGFKSYGLVETIAGTAELFILTKEDYLK